MRNRPPRCNSGTVTWEALRAARDGPGRLAGGFGKSGDHFHADAGFDQMRIGSGCDACFLAVMVDLTSELGI
jgi:hypothetical protein